MKRDHKKTLHLKHAKIYIRCNYNRYSPFIYRDIYETIDGEYVINYNGDVRTLYLSDYGHGWNWYLNPLTEEKEK